ncbi:hypothetical protein GB931_20315 [Modestobacter sp. I12A-02628]|uniref:TIGR02611 family protein n=1 Tax=Goekera deserti TaxID=2497753 RepID=A0A7K3W8D7_9ACTN|nr:PGPGW domain-containing protein [Goekera deserti]MPR00217.1 hypothetical protein [Goekera deserti]NDI49391.1 hypothetical protein [Goekera deserti]NEL52735.1 hypothetical protein [Goekera deserti]
MTRPSTPQHTPATDRRTVVAGNTVADDRSTSGARVWRDGLGESHPPRPGSLRARVHANPALTQVWRVGVFVLGLLLVALGVALTVLPGPLTIPPVLAGLWVWSTEFAWARRFFDAFKKKARDAWDHAKEHPASSLAITVGGLALAAVAFWAVGHFQLVDRVEDLF